MKIIVKFLLAAILIVFCDAKLLAQNTDMDSVAVNTGDLTQQKPYGDTTLTKQIFDANNSIDDYKKEKDFAYMKYLDSLLRQTKDITVDTFTIYHSNSPARKKHIQKERDESPANRVPQINIFSLPLVKIILWVLAAILIGFIIYKLFLGENFFKRNRTNKNITEQKEEEDISDPSAYDKLIAQAAGNKNYRLAIRYSYLKTLQMLAGIGSLQFSADKTNYQYVNELRGKPYQNDFAAITLNYEYVWYGKFDINENVYSRLSNEYRSFQQKL